MDEQKHQKLSVLIPVWQRFRNLVMHLSMLMALYMLLRLLFYLFNSGYYEGLTLIRVWDIFRGGLLFDLSALMYLNGVYIVLYLLPLAFVQTKVWQKFMFWLFIIPNAVAISFNTGDIIYFDFTLKRTTADVFIFAGENNMGALFLDFLRDYWYGFLIGILLIATMIIGYRKLCLPQQKIRFRFSYFIVALFVWALSGFLSVMGMRGSFTDKTFPITIGDAGEFADKPLDMALVLNTPFTIMKTIERQSLQEKQYFTEQALDSIYQTVYQPVDDKAFQAQNVVFLVMESFSREYVGFFNPAVSAEESLTPFLDSLSGESYCFMRAFANGRQSISALPAICAGIPYAEQPFVTSAYAFNEIIGLGQLLKKENYHTSFFHGANNGSLGLGAFMNLAGYDHYFGKNEYGNDADYDGSWGIRDQDFFRFFVDKLNEFPQPFHSVIFSLSSHPPYTLPENYTDSFPHIKDPMHRAYRYCDYAIRIFFEAAKQTEWYKNTLFVITADHGTRSKTDKKYMSTVGGYAIPIIFYQPTDTVLRAKDSSVVQQLDIMPSTAAYLGYDKAFFSFGKNAFEADSAGEAFVNVDALWQYIRGDYVLLFQNDEAEGLYNYETDPSLEHNLISEKPNISTEYEIKLKAFIQRHNHAMIHNALKYKP